MALNSVKVLDINGSNDDDINNLFSFLLSSFSASLPFSSLNLANRSMWRVLHASVSPFFHFFFNYLRWKLVDVRKGKVALDALSFLLLSCDNKVQWCWCRLSRRENDGDVYRGIEFPCCCNVSTIAKNYLSNFCRKAWISCDRSVLSRHHFVWKGININLMPPCLLNIIN